MEEMIVYEVVFYLLIFLGIFVAIMKKDELFLTNLIIGIIFALGFALSSNEVYFFSISLVAYGVLLAKVSKKEFQSLKWSIFIVFLAFVVLSGIYFVAQRWEVVFFASGVVMIGTGLLYERVRYKSRII